MTHRELRAMIVHLSDYQVNRLGQMAAHFLALKQELAETKPDCCPVCGDENAVFIRKGFQNGKQRFQCKSCGHKFTYDTNQLTSGSHQPLESWVTLIGDAGAEVLGYHSEVYWGQPLDSLQHAPQAAGVFGTGRGKHASA